MSTFIVKYAEVSIRLKKAALAFARVHNTHPSRIPNGRYARALERLGRSAIAYERVIRKAGAK